MPTHGVLSGAFNLFQIKFDEALMESFLCCNPNANTSLCSAQMISPNISQQMQADKEVNQDTILSSKDSLSLLLNDDSSLFKEIKAIVRQLTKFELNKISNSMSISSIVSSPFIFNRSSKHFKMRTLAVARNCDPNIRIKIENNFFLIGILENLPQ